MKFIKKFPKKYIFWALGAYTIFKIVGTVEGYKALKDFSDSHIKNFYSFSKIQQTINENAYLPHTFFVSVPLTDNANKTIDLYLEKMETIYSATTINRHLVPYYIIQFAKDREPDRLMEVAEKGVDFLIKHQHLKESYIVATLSEDSSLIEKATNAWLPSKKEVKKSREVPTLESPFDWP